MSNTHDPYRRVYRSRAVGRVLSGEDNYQKEALEGPPGGDLEREHLERKERLHPPRGARFGALLDEKARGPNGKKRGPK